MKSMALREGAGALAQEIAKGQRKPWRTAISTKQPPNYPTMALAAVWLAAVVGAMVMLLNYSNSPGRVGAIPAHWPAGSRISFDARQPNLILFAHPRCPCTRATLGELELLMARCHGQLCAQVWFIKPEGMSDDWMSTDLWRTASAIPGVTVHCDNGLLEARRFGAETSGQTLLYDQDGQLLFRGGITISRGHSGDNPGRSALRALLERKLSNQVQTPVFGCSLFETACRKGEIAWKP
jgi:hypothetical protein